MADTEQEPPGLFGPDGFQPSWGALGNVAFGGLQTAGGVLVGVPSAALAFAGFVTPEPTVSKGVALAGAAGAVWSLDQVQAGGRTIWAGLFGGEAAQSVGSQLLGGGALGFLYDLGPGGIAALKKG